GIRVAYAAAGGRWQRTQVLDPNSIDETDSRPAGGLVVAFTADGTGEAVGGSRTASSTTGGSAGLSGTTFATPPTVAPPGAGLTVDSLAVGRHGQVITAWSEGSPDAPKVFSSARSGGQWGTPELIAAGVDGSVAFDPVTGVPFAVFVTSRGVEYSKNG